MHDVSKLLNGKERTKQEMDCLQIGWLLPVIIDMPRFSVHSEYIRICAKAQEVSIEMKMFRVAGDN
jgi:hypothetical protein